MSQGLILAKFLQNDTVQLRIDADTWVIGVIITVVHICTKVIALQLLDIVRFADRQL